MTSILLSVVSDYLKICIIILFIVVIIIVASAVKIDDWGGELKLTLVKPQQHPTTLQNKDCKIFYRRIKSRLNYFKESTVNLYEDGNVSTW